MSVQPDFEDALRRFDKVARDLSIPYALIGGIAVILQGHRRATNDIDITVWNADHKLESLIRALTTQGFTLRIPDAETFAQENRIILVKSSAGVDLDISLGALPFEEAMILRADRREIGTALQVGIATPEDLVIMKIFAGRPRDLDDARRMAELFPNLDRSRIEGQVAEFAAALDRSEMLENLQTILKPKS